MARAGPRRVQRYSLEVKLKAVKLSHLKDVQVQAVAEALEIHPFMPAYRGRRRGRSEPAGPVRDPGIGRR